MATASKPRHYYAALANELKRKQRLNLERGRAPSGCPEHPARDDERAACAADFAHFLQHWVFRDREKTGTESVMRFDSLWEGQERMVIAMKQHRWVYILKAGKLGATELECAYDGWVALFRGANARVNIFSKDGKAAKELLDIVRFGLQRLPEWLALPFVSKNEAGGDNSEQFTLIGDGVDDIRRVVSYPASPDAAIDVSATHCLSGDSLVYLAERNTQGKRRGMRIREVVRTKHPGPVIAVGPDGRMVERAITGWSMNPLDERAMVEVTTHHAPAYGGPHGSGQRNVHLTVDHKVLTGDGWCEAGDLRPGMLIATGEAAPNQRQAALVTGTMLGDGSASARRWSTVHVHADYSTLIADAIGVLATTRDARATTDRQAQRIVEGRAAIWAAQLREAWYEGRRKIVNRAAVEAMGEIGIAAWYLDDGFLCRSENGTPYAAKFSTDCFTEDEVRWLAAWLTGHGIDARAMRAAKGNWHVYVPASGLQALMRVVGPYAPASMRYKIAGGPDFNPEAWVLGEPVCGLDEVVVRPWEPPAHERSVFCISVDEVHNFATPGGIVSNSHVDEMARMPFPGKTWASIASTVPPDGSVHIVTRGAGEGSYATELWYEAKDGISPLHCIFEPFNARPRIPQGEVPPGADPAEVWYAEQAATTLAAELNYSAPRTEEDALKGSAEGQFVPEAVWLACYDPDLQPIMPGDRTPLVLGVDAGIVSDNFAVVAVSRHPDRPGDPAVRMVRVWQPPKGGAIDFDEVERFLRVVCLGGCVNGHPNKPGNIMSDGQMCAEHPAFVHQHKITGLETCSGPPMPCAACTGNVRAERFNVAQVAYDSFQLVDMMQRMSRDRVAWCRSFSQGSERLIADANLRVLIINRRLTHRNDPMLNMHVAAANAKSAPGEDTKLRIVKRNPGSKIDSAVALSMATAECLRLILQNAR